MTTPWAPHSTALSISTVIARAKVKIFALSQSRDLLDRREILVGDGRHPRLDPVDADLVEHLGDADLVLLAEHHPGGLLPVPERGVVDLHLLRQLEAAAHLIDEVVRADPPQIFLDMPVFHSYSLFSFPVGRMFSALRHISFQGLQGRSLYAFSSDCRQDRLPSA